METCKVILLGPWAMQIVKNLAMNYLEDVPEFDMLLNDKLKVSDCYTIA